MKNAQKKVPRNFRLASDINSELKRRSDITGIPETTILEYALDGYFKKSMAGDIRERFKKIGKDFVTNFKTPPQLFVNATELFGA